MTTHAALILFDLPSRMRVFTITIGQVPTCYLMDIAATVVLSRLNSIEIYPNLFLCLSVPPWVHVFAMPTKFTSLRTLAASIAYIEEPLHKNKKARYCRNRRAKKKQEKQHRLLTEVIVPESITPNLLTDMIFTMILLLLMVVI